MTTIFTAPDLNTPLNVQIDCIWTYFSDSNASVGFCSCRPCTALDDAIRRCRADAEREDEQEQRGRQAGPATSPFGAARWAASPSRGPPGTRPFRAPGPSAATSPRAGTAPPAPRHVPAPARTRSRGTHGRPTSDRCSRGSRPLPDLHRVLVHRRPARGSHTRRRRRRTGRPGTPRPASHGAASVSSPGNRPIWRTVRICHTAHVTCHAGGWSRSDGLRRTATLRRLMRHPFVPRTIRSSYVTLPHVPSALAPIPLDRART